MIYKIYKILLLAVSILLTAFCYAQKTNFTEVLNAFTEINYKEVATTLQKIDTTKITNYDKATWLYYHADYQFGIDNHHNAYASIIKSKKKFIALKKQEDVMDCNILLLGILSHQKNLKINTNTIIDEMEKYAIVKKDNDFLSTVYYKIALKFYNLKNTKESLKYFNKMIQLSISENDSLTIAHTYMNIGSIHSALLNDPDSALYYTKKALPTLIKHKDYRRISYNYNNQGNNYKIKGDYTNAIKYFKKSLAISFDKHTKKSKVLYFENIADAYYKNKDYKNASLFLNKKIALQDSINDIQQNIAITGIKEKYDNEKLRADNLTIEAEKTKKNNQLITSLLVLLFGAITSFLVYKNSKRKQRITQTEKLFEQQKVANLLKEQELIAIDAMIEGQEKERQLIASDLHDDLGALMATLQFNFENLHKHKDQKDADKLFTKTKGLIKEAYQKIRSIAHAKNSGVIAKQGLLKAITNNANKISQLNNIDIEVRAHGLENRLENSLELTLFRIVQELLANIIKHANAGQVIIHFTNHKDALNIMVEDNGKGFNQAKISKSDGMGIKSIEKRVEFLEGTFTIESFINKGTTVIIDIPL